MSRTMTMEPPAGTINPHTGHMEMPMNPDNVALYRAIGPDQPDPPAARERRASQEYHSDGPEEDKDPAVDHLEDHQEEVGDHLEVEDRQEEYQYLCHRHPNQEGITGTN
jgi:hypothetical protein